MTRRTKTAVLISGSGSNMVALTKASKAHDYPASIDLVISNKPNALGLSKANGLSIETHVIDHTKFKTRLDFEQALDSRLRASNIEFVCCAGFMRVLSPWFVKRWQGRCINIHPSLLPKYKGLHTHQRALEAGDKD
ncbi:MAG TPA: phosphoribosylglycinamide formyltransferase, partial [Hellea balneolensis]|nr:phosphoribosylglycinamide formyltransferase [Hellea balneolensis]